MTSNTKFALAAAVAAVMLTGCQKREFTVKGTIEGAADSTLYLQQMSLTGVEMIDSTVVGKDGTFEISAKAPEASPEFYVLRIQNQIINLAIDSTETITIKAQYPNMASRYEVEGSQANADIRLLALRQQALQEKIVKLQNDFGAPTQAAQDSLLRLVEEYKSEIINEFILKSPEQAQSASAYFALFQTIGQWLIFNPQTNPADMRVFRAVASSWDTFHPGTPRTENLHNITIEGMKTQRIVAQRNATPLDENVVEESGIIDIALPDNNGNVRRLSELRGKVVVLDFHSFTMPDSPQRILALRDLWNKYHEQGLEIYQVSVDADEHFWQQKAAQLPWICVRDAEGIAARNYNVSEIPEFFSIDRHSQLQKRSSQMKDLEQEIKSLL